MKVVQDMKDPLHLRAVPVRVTKDGQESLNQAANSTAQRSSWPWMIKGSVHLRLACNPKWPRMLITKGEAVRPINRSVHHSPDRHTRGQP
jgi:hypothetical protein